MKKQHLVAPVVMQRIENLQDKSSPSFNRDNYAILLEETRKAIDIALSVYNSENKKK